ncbi:TPR repeat-containing protein [Blastochloris viridis]|uniref:Cell division coordinator CpoB n=1 Tax=Blastochloris viridis TaxID=1079 RepID=A0A182D2B6_BLAVI|nr:TPR repeat-containing protein [Blastochloris viridis]
MASAPVLAQSGLDRSDLRPPGEVSSPLAQLFGSPPQAEPRVDGGELIVRLNQIEGQLRQLNGQIEQLQFRNQQLEQNLRRMQEDFEYRFQELGGRGGAAAPAPQRPPQAAPAPGAAPQRRSDVFDPSATPGAPGAPRALGSSSAPVPPGDGPVGAPGGRDFGQPLDITGLASRAASDPTLAPPPPPPVIPPALPGRAGTADGARAPAPAQQAALPPGGGSAQADYQRAYNAVLQQDHETAETGFRGFLRAYPRDKLVPNATYWLGESLYQRQRYRDAAEQFLKVSSDYPKAQVAPNALLRLGQSLAALGEREAACATFGEASRKHPNAPQSVKQGLEQEKKRGRC